MKIPKDVNLVCAILCMLLVMWAAKEGRWQAVTFSAVFMVANILFFVFGKDDDCA